VGLYFHRLPHASGPDPAFVCVIAGVIGRGLGSGAPGVRLAALDPLVRHQLPDLGIRQIGDNIVGSEVPLGAETRRGGSS